MSTKITWYQDRFMRKLDSKLEEATTEATEILKEDTINKAPIKTGFLRDNIKSVSTTTYDHKNISQVISYAPYSILLEKGTRYMSPKPFMVPALYASFNRMMAKFRNLF